MFLLLVLRLALAVALDAIALTLWDVGTRPPHALLADARGALRTRQGLFAGAVRFLAGLALLALAALIVASALTSRHAFTVVETGALIAALVVEQLIGPDLRGRRIT